MSFPAHCNHIFRGLSIVITLFLGWSMAPPASLGQDTDVRFDPKLADKLELSAPDAIIDVLITCGDQPEWDINSLPLRKDERGRFVYQRLRQLAEISQKSLRSALYAWGVDYRPYYIVNAVEAKVPAGKVRELANISHVSAVALNSPVAVEEVDTSPIQSRSVTPEWGILHIHADSVWNLGFRGQGVVIAGEDTGYEWEHPAIRAKYRGTTDDGADHAYNWHDAIHEINPLNGDTVISPSNNPCGLNSPFPCDDGGHGTHTMGTMVGSDGENEIGVAPDAKWIACRNMERGWGMPSTYLECMEFFLAPTDENGENPDPAKSPHVINNSWSCPPQEGCNPENFELMRQAVVNLRAAGIVMVVSAGNSGSGCGSVSTPLAMFEESFSIGAININDTIANFSSRGPVVVDSSMRLKPNVSAPGVQVRSSWLGGSYRNASGTSMAGPHVAGTVALMISANPALAGQVEVIESILESTARSRTTEQECGEVPGLEIPNNTFGYGVIDALAAVEAALLISATDDPEPIVNGPLLIFPNPASDVLHIAGDSELRDLQSLRLFAIDGRQVAELRDLALPAEIGIGQLPDGLYVLKADNLMPLLVQVLK